MKKLAQTFVNLALTAALTFSTLTLALTGANTGKLNQQAPLATTAVATQVASVEDAELRIKENLTEKTNVLAEAANAKFEQQLAAKVATQFTL